MIQVKKLVKRFGLKTVLRSLDFEVVAALYQLGSAFSSLAKTLRLMAGHELASEGFAEGQVGSSAMPHKRNPISAENLTGLARLVRSNSFAAMENVALWHQRDISHSSVERVIGPDSTILLDYMLDRMTRMMDQLVVYPQNMMANLEKSRGMIYSEGILLKLKEEGITFLLVEQNANLALDLADYAYLLETGRIKSSGTATELLASDAIKKAYLGI